MDFVVATIPTMLALEESARLVAALRAEDVPVSTMVVNQVVGEGMGEKYLAMKLKEQAAALRMLEASPHLSPLEVIRGKQLDLEVRGLPALQYIGGTVWAGIPLPAAGSGEGIVRSSAPRPTFSHMHRPPADAVSSQIHRGIVPGRAHSPGYALVVTSGVAIFTPSPLAGCSRDAAACMHEPVPSQRGAEERMCS